MTNTEKTRILKEMRKRIEVGRYAGMCAVLEEINREEGLRLTLSELGITRRSWGNGEYWFPKYEKEPRLKLIDEALAKCETKFRVGDRVRVVSGSGSANSDGDVGIITEIKNGLVRVTVEGRSNCGNFSYPKDVELIPELDPIQQAEQRVKEAQAELERLRNAPKDVEGLYKGQNMFWLEATHNRTVFINPQSKYSPEAYLSKERAEKELLRVRLAFIADSLNGGLLEIDGSDMGYFICHSKQSDRIETGTTTTHAYGFVLFKTRELAEEAMTYFTKEELIKMLK